MPSPRAAPSNASSSSATPAAPDVAPSTGYVVGPDEPPLTVAAPGRREEIQRITGLKPSPEVYDASLLQGRVRGIWESLDHGLSAYFSPEAPSIFNQANRAFDFVNDRGGEVLRLARLLLGEVEWKILAIFPERLWKTFGSRVTAPTERAGYNRSEEHTSELQSQR